MDVPAPAGKAGRDREDQKAARAREEMSEGRGQPVRIKKGPAIPGRPGEKERAETREEGALRGAIAGRVAVEHGLPTAVLCPGRGSPGRNGVEGDLHRRNVVDRSG